MSKRKEFKYWFNDTCDQFVITSHAIRSRCLFRQQTSYQRIEIYETHKFGRMLAIDGFPQSAEGDEIMYHQALVHPAAIMLERAPQFVLILGGGEGATLREVLRYKSVERVVMVDIDEVVIHKTQELIPSMWKGAEHDSRSSIIVADARKYLKDPISFGPNLSSFDLIISDITDPGEDESASAQLYTEDYFALIRSRLAPKGGFVMQSQELSRLIFEGHKKNREMVQKFFPQVFSYHRYIPSFAYDQSFVLAGSSIRNPYKLGESFVDYLVRSRTGDTLEEYSGEMHSHLFALSPYLKRKLNII